MTSSWVSIARRALLIFVPLALLALLAIVAVLRTQESASRQLVEGSEAAAVDQARNAIQVNVAARAADVRFLAEASALKTWLDTREPAARATLATDFLVFATSHPVYDQIRFLDLTGQEVVRIDRRGGAAAIVGDLDLQNKADRPYFREAVNLDRGAVYQSAFDLNVEHGAIEEPLKPTIRFVTPVFDARGERRGIVVLNYLAQALINRVREIDRGTVGELDLLNAGGYWLAGPRPELEWGFMFPARSSASLAVERPVAWRAIVDGPPSGVIRSEGDTYVYARFVASSVVLQSSRAAAGPLDPATGLVLVGRLPAAALAAQTSAIRRPIWFAALALGLLLAGTSYGIARQWLGRDQAVDRLRHNEARFRGLIEAAPDAIVVTDVAGIIRFVNAQTAALFGYDEAHLVGKPVEILVPDASRGRHEGHRAAYAAEPKARVMLPGEKLVALRRDGSTFPASISLSPVMIDNELLIFSDIRDVTAAQAASDKIAALNQDLVHRNAELETVNRELEAFSYSVSHDLRTPLRAIDGFSQALAEDAGDRLDAVNRLHLQRIRAAAQRMAAIIDDLITLARVARSDVSRDRVDLSKLSQEIATELREAEPQRSGEFEIDPGLVVEADPRLIRVAMENLLGNAWKFTSRRAAARITVGRAPDDAIYVRDNGTGFDMQFAGKLFDPFQRLHDDQSYPGTGIGLATVDRIIRKHGGRIWADAKPEEGATFYFKLAA